MGSKMKLLKDIRSWKAGKWFGFIVLILFMFFSVIGFFRIDDRDVISFLTIFAGVVALVWGSVIGKRFIDYKSNVGGAE